MHMIPVIQVRNSSLIMYNIPTDPKPRLTINNPFSGKKQTYSGTVTVGSKKRISKAVTLLLQSTPERYIKNPVTSKTHKFSISFITLTVSSTSEMLTAKQAHHLLLEPFLLYLRRYHSMRSYVWKAELQKRGQIHYHITSDCFINHRTLRQKWNELQQKHGLLADYFQLKSHYNANSTDVHSVYKIRNIEAYLVKYMAKPGSETETTTGKVWDCSTNLKKSTYFTTTCSFNYDSELFKRENAGNIDVYRAERFTIIKFKNGNANQILSKADRAEYRTHMLNVRSGTGYDSSPKRKPKSSPVATVSAQPVNRKTQQYYINYTEKLSHPSTTTQPPHHYNTTTTQNQLHTNTKPTPNQLQTNSKTIKT